MVRTRLTRYCLPLCKGKQEWVQNGKGRWKCLGCGRTGLLIRGRHRSWPPAVPIPVWGDWRGARNEVVGHVLVSPIDAYLAQWKWRANKDGYVYRQTWVGVKGKRKRCNLFIHRVILKLGPDDPLEGHHKDDEPWNNQRWNLEVVTRDENEKYKHYRNIRTRRLTVTVAEKAPEPPKHEPKHRAAVLEIVRVQTRDNGLGFALKADVLREAAQHGMTPEQATDALHMLLLTNQVYNRMGNSTFAPL